MHYNRKGRPVNASISAESGWPDRLKTEDGRRRREDAQMRGCGERGKAWTGFTANVGEFHLIKRNGYGLGNLGI
jgi:hypothetical protein